MSVKFVPSHLPSPELAASFAEKYSVLPTDVMLVGVGLPRATPMSFNRDAAGAMRSSRDSRTSRDLGRRRHLPCEGRAYSLASRARLFNHERQERSASIMLYPFRRMRTIPSPHPGEVRCVYSAAALQTRLAKPQK